MQPVVESFIRYIKIDTESARKSETYPSTLKQLNQRSFAAQSGLAVARVPDLPKPQAAQPASTWGTD